MKLQDKIKVGQYVFTKDGNILYVKDILDGGFLCGMDIDKHDDKEKTISAENIVRVVDEICKNVIVE